MKRVLVTGGCGFIGSEFVRRSVLEHKEAVTNLDALTYAGDPRRLEELSEKRTYSFCKADIADREAVKKAFEDARPDRVVHFAAESHVTRGEHASEAFWRTNVIGTEVILEISAQFRVDRFLHISTDEVYGSSAHDAFSEEDKQFGTSQATSAYSKSKSAADDLALTAARDGLPVIVARPTNCFGPWQYPEKAFPRWATRALTGRPLLVWGDGKYVRQWLHVSDLVRALRVLLEHPQPHRVYNIGPRLLPEITNNDVAYWLATESGLPREMVRHTGYDRPDHDRRYAVKPDRIEQLGWSAGEVWTQFGQTLQWYRQNEDWWKPLVEDAESIYEDEES